MWLLFFFALSDKSGRHSQACGSEGNNYLFFLRSALLYSLEFSVIITINFQMNWRVLFPLFVTFTSFVYSGV